MDEIRFFTPFFNADVILTSERKRHIQFRHADLGSPLQVERMIRVTLATPSIVQTSKSDSHAIIFAKWHPDLHKGKFLLVVVVDDPERKWIITAYSSHEVPEGEILWQQD